PDADGLLADTTGEVQVHFQFEHQIVPLLGPEKMGLRRPRGGTTRWTQDCAGRSGTAPGRLSRGEARRSGVPGSRTPCLPSRLAPYLDRACLRSATPWESSTPRMMW